MQRPIRHAQDMHQPFVRTGFAHPTRHELRIERRSGALAGLIAGAALAVGTVVAATAVSIGIARASAAGASLENEGGVFALALLLGLVLAGMGGLTALMLPGERRTTRE